MDRPIAHANAAGVVPPLSSRTAVVTGGANGIGRAIALRLAADGTTVVVDRKPADDPGPGEGFIVADLARPDDCTGAIARARATYGPISILVNNAGFQHVSSLASFPRERW
jgi:3-hydroxybutyrate dehydrogenase